MYSNVIRHVNSIEKPIAAIESTRMILRELEPEDVNDRYLCWMNDPDITKYLETRFYPQTKEGLNRYVREKLTDKNLTFLGIILKNGCRHIGNIKIGPVNWNHSFGSIGIMIGEKDCFRKGYATEAIGLVVDLTFRRLHLHKLTAGCYEKNVGALKAFKKNNFIIEGVRKQHAMYHGEFIDVIELGLINPE